jgi:hypothetical protein
MELRKVFGLYAGALFALELLIALVVSVMGGPPPGVAGIILMALGALAGAGLGVYLHTVLHSGVAGFLGWSTGGDPGPMLAQARVFIKLEKWEEARGELDKAWAEFPGNGLVLREYERLLLEGMHAPSGLCDFFRQALPKLEPEDKAYAMLRLAEVNGEVLGNRQESVRWCVHFLKEFPGHRDAESVTALKARYEKGAGA